MCHPDLADRVFKGKIDYSRLTLTNMSYGGGTKFTIPSISRQFSFVRFRHRRPQSDTQSIAARAFHGVLSPEKVVLLETVRTWG